MLPLSFAINIGVLQSARVGRSQADRDRPMLADARTGGNCRTSRISGAKRHPDPPCRTVSW
jgi:hypothetical protein